VLQFLKCYVECHYAECHCAECHYAERRYAERHYAECRYAECRYAECNCAECHYAECRYAECRGTYLSSSLKLTGQDFSIIDNLGQTLQSFLLSKLHSDMLQLCQQILD